LSVYVLLQFVWWGFHLVQLTELTNESKEIIQKRVVMIIGEGSVFLLILILGLIRMRFSIRNELQVNQNQTNFLLSVTHELKTPIASTKLYLQTILKREFEPEKRNELIKKGLSENNRLEKMIDNILNASRLENQNLTLHKQKIELNGFLKTIVDRYQKMHPETDFIMELDTVEDSNLDPFLIETILNNLIENAVKYGGEEKKVIVRVSQSSALRIEIIDFGTGVHVNDQKAIFTKFYRAGNEETRNQKGSGLGLFIASEFTRLHGGTLKYRPNTPKGAIFELTL